MKCYRCGWCGQPTTEDGEELSLELIKSMNVDWNTAESVQGDCCRAEHEHRQQVEVSREMAMDAGMPELEGMMVDW